MNKKVITLAGSPGSGKTEMVIQYCNKFPIKTLLLTMQYCREIALERGLNKEVDSIHHNNLDEIDISKYETICIDNLQLFEKEVLNPFLTKAFDANIRVVIVVTLPEGAMPF